MPMVECKKFKRIFNFNVDEKCKGYTPKSCKTCTQPHVEPSEYIDDMVKRKKIGKSLFRVLT